MTDRSPKLERGLHRPSRHYAVCVWLCCLLPCALLRGQTSGQIEIDFMEDVSQVPIPCRVQILDSDGKPKRAASSLFYRGWNLIEGTLAYRGRVGEYTYRAEHGPQFAAARGGFTLDKRSQAIDVVRLPRHADLESEGWFGGDLLAVAGPAAAELERWLPAEDLAMAVVVHSQPMATEPKVIHTQQRWVERASFWDQRPGSGLVLHHWTPPADVPESLPSSRLLVLAKHANRAADGPPVHAEIQRLWARDVPVWLASGLIDSIQLLGEHVTFESMGAAPAVPPIDPAPGRFRGEQAAARTIELVYWQVLESGLRIAPTAGSAFGNNASPLGHNRVYAWLDRPTPEAWWLALREGRSFVTSGPLLRVSINGQLPGQTFNIADGESLALDIALTLTVADPVDYVDVIFNGETLYQARLDEHARRGGRIPRLDVEESGWLVVRVVTQRASAYGMATTAPYYFEVGGRRRISRAAVEFFQRWLDKSAEQIRDLGGQAESSAKVYLDAARSFWQKQLAAATAE